MHLNAEQIRELNEKALAVRDMVRSIAADELLKKIAELERRFGLPIRRVDVEHVPVETLSGEELRPVLARVRVELGETD